MTIVLGRDLTYELVTLMLALTLSGSHGRPVCFIDDDKIRAVEQKLMFIPIGFQEVDTGHLDRVVPVNTLAACLAPIQLTDRSGPDDHRFQVEFLDKLLLPLFAKVGRTQYAKTLDFTPIKKFAGDEQGLDCLANPHVVRDEDANWVQPQCHQQGHELIYPRSNGDPAK